MLASVFEKASLNKDLIPKNHAICCLKPYPTPSLDKLLLKISFEEKTSISIIYMHVCMPLKNLTVTLSYVSKFAEPIFIALF